MKPIVVRRVVKGKEQEGEIEFTFKTLDLHAHSAFGFVPESEIWDVINEAADRLKGLTLKHSLPDV